MAFRDAVRRRLASLLQPWLVEEPEIEVELGIINSRVTARHLSLDASSLNSYLDGSYRFAVAQVTVELFSVRFSNWSAPAFDFEVRGLNVVLSAGQPKEEERSVGGRRTWTSEDADEEKKKEVASHDPEGSDLHDLLEKMLSTSCSSSSFKNSLLNVVLAHCRLQMFNTSLEVQYPSVNEAPLCLAELKSLSVESNYYEGCFARRLMTAVLRPQKETSFVMDFTGFEVGYRLKDQSAQVVSSADLLGYARYSDLQLVDFSIHVSEWNLLLSPIDLPVLLVFVNTFSKISKRVRNGGQLWRLAATRLRRVSPKLSLYNVVEFACLWLRYLRSYECLLLMVHYADKGSLKVFIGKMCKDKKLLNSVKEFWGIISDVEKELPAEYIAQARRIARYRVAKSIIQGHEGNYISSSSGLVKIFSKAFKGLAVIWNIICRIFLWTLQFFYLTNIFIQKPKVHSLLEAVSENDIPEVCFLIEFGKISISLSPISGFENDNKQIEPPVDISTSELHSFCLSIDALVLLYLNGTFEQSIFVSCGQLKVDPSYISTSSSEGHDLGPAKVSKKVPPEYAKSVLWSEPAQTLVSGQPGTDAGVQVKGACYGLLKEIMGEMWLAWERTCLELDARDVDYSDNPWLLCQVKNCLMVPDLNTPDFQCSKCCMSLGKLTLSLGYQSVLSALILCYQIEQALSLANHGQSVSASSQATTVQELPDSELGIKYDLYVGEMKKTFLKMIPKKQVQLGLFITGIDIEILSSQAGFPCESKHLNGVIGQDGFHLELDICSIEVAVWPSSKFDIGLAKFPGSHDLEPRGSRLRDTEAIEIPGTENEKYASQGCVSLGSYMKVNGLNFTIGEMKGRKDYGFLILKPITLQLSLFRECVHSFGSTVVAFSVALHVEATGLSIFSCMDEVEDLLQVVAGLVSEVPTAFGNFDLVGRSPQTYMRHNVMFEEADTDDTNVKGAPLIDKSLMFKITSSFAFREMGMILQKARIHDGVEGYIKIEDAFVSEEKSGIPDLSSYGIGMFSRQSNLEISCEERKLEVHCHLAGVHSVIFRSADSTESSFSYSASYNLLQQSHDCMHELSLPNCNISLWLGQRHVLDDSLVLSSSGGPSIDEGSHSLGEAETLSVPSCSASESSGFASPSTDQSASYSVIINVELDLLSVSRCSAKKLVIAHQYNKLTSLILVGGDLQTISWDIQVPVSKTKLLRMAHYAIEQGGPLFIEVTALSLLARCSASSLRRITDIVSILNTSFEHTERNKRRVQETTGTPQQTKWELPKASTLNVSQLSLVLAVEDDSGCFQELVIGVDIHVKLQSNDILTELVFEVSRMSIFSQIAGEQFKTGNRTPHFSSIESNGSSSRPYGNPAVTSSGIGSNHINHQNDILKHLVVSVTAEKQKNGPANLSEVWAGQGSISGFDMTVSLSEIQLISSMLSSFSATPHEEAAHESTKKRWFTDDGSDRETGVMVPDGAIVSIQDVHQHMYFAVEEGENKYNMIGAIHYSLAGGRALFRVKHHVQRIWKSSIVWFSLISLHAKNHDGEPFRLSYRPGSSFVDISSTSENAGSLWRIISREPESSKDGIDWEPYNKLVKNTFYLVNKKNDCAVAFVRDVPEFVRKPGNPFKFKVFHDVAMVHDVATSHSYPMESSGSGVNGVPAVRHDQRQSSAQSESLPCIQIRINSVSLTIVHELLDSKDRSPLLRCCINNAKLNVQVLSSKTRVMSTSTASVSYFDSQRSEWSEFAHPVDICTFYRSRVDSRTDRRRLPVDIYCRTNEVHISLSELALDVLLFVIGKLDLAGPFAVRSSKILSNCCKVDNQSGLELICHLGEDRSIKVIRGQSASIFLRYNTSANQLVEKVSAISIQLSNSASWATSSVHLSLVKSQIVAWRTRIMSPQDSRTYPGPFVVVDISRRSEDGLKIVVSPMVRIHNETGFPLELRFRRPQENEDVFASVFLQKGDAIDDTLATFDAISSSGGLKKTLMSLSVGNFLFAFRPEVPDGSINSMSPVSAEWSDDFKGGKAVRLSGIFDKLGYKVRKALSVESMKCSFSTAYCSLKSEDAHIIDLHFLIQNIGRDIPIAQPDTNHDGSESRNSAVALREQREIFILPTVRVSNLLDSDIQVLLTETDVYTSISSVNIGKQATVSSGSTVDFYANPAIIYFTVTLAAFGSTSKPVNSGDWVKKLRKNKTDVPCLDIDLDFGGGKYFASLRLSRGPRGVLEAAIFTPYSLKNETEFSLFFFAPNQKTLSRYLLWLKMVNSLLMYLFLVHDCTNVSRSELETSASNIPPDVGLFLPPKSISSCFLRSHKMQLIVLQHHQSKALLDLDALSALTEISLKIEEESRVKYIVKLGVLVGPSLSKVVVPSQMVTLVPRHVVFNESSESITIRQCYLEDETTGIVSIGSKQRKALLLQSGIAKSKELNSFENFIRRHKNDVETSLLYVQFRLDKSGSSWSGPVCIASLGRFFVKFRKEPDQVQLVDNSTTEFAAVFVAEEGSVLGVHFHKPPNIGLPYRIENHLHDTSITYYQKDSAEREVLGSNSSAFYVWDDLTLSHKLVVLVNGMHLLREINLDKVRTWKPFTKLTPLRSLASHSHLEGKADQKSSQLNTIAVVRIGYEVYAEGATRVLRICEFSDSHKGDRSSQSSARIQLRLAELAVRFLEQGKEDSDDNEELHYSPLAVARLGNVDLDSVITDEQKYNLVTIQSLTVDNKWADAPFAAMLRRHQLESNDSDFPVLKVFFVPLSISSKVTQVKYSSIILQPIDLNIDEETLMRFASFWRSSLSDSTAPSRQYYFDYFEIHPVKIIANFLPGDSYSSYSSTQETLRSLIHSVVKVPTIKNMVVELNGVLVTHALITMRELFIKCAQHYSWYAMRAIYIAKGSPLLPPAFASIFDDMASSSLDVFFDPSRGLVSLPGLTLGTFKFISNCIDGRGFSGTKRYFGDLGKTVRGFRQGILNLAMEPSVIGTAVMVGGPDRKIKLDRSPGVDELYIEGYLQAMLDSMYKQEYLRVRVIDDQVILKNLPPNSSLIDEIMDRVKAFLVSKALLKGDASSSSRPFRNLRGENDWKIGPTVLTLCEHLFVSFAIRALRKQTVKVSGKVLANIKWKNEETAATGEEVGEDGSSNAIVPALDGGKMRFVWQWGVGKFVLSGILAYIDGRLCRRIPNPIARRIVGGYLLSFLDKDENDK
ncbi:unnamed protein product [Linum tenue]|uniref:Vacuolar protein sorting-associated protein 13 VPS13 adaptor binding domain-containing protein n=1 Tax=Linum tenue TaxID=586396 RepID=A0AAV0R9K2_9ROSI|nr:unnamed protein product [Linum tenue]